MDSSLGTAFYVKLIFENRSYKQLAEKAVIGVNMEPYIPFHVKNNSGSKVLCPDSHYNYCRIVDVCKLNS